MSREHILNGVYVSESGTRSEILTGVYLSETVSTAATAAPSGWWRPFEQVAARVIIPAALVASGLVWCPQPITAAVTPTVTLDWQQPLSKAVPVAQAQQGHCSFVVPPFAVPSGWQTPLSTALPVATAVQGSSFVPFNTLQTNTATIDKWLVPLSTPAPVAQAKAGSAFVPLNTAQINTQTIDKWQQPFVAAVKVSGPVHSQPSFVTPQFDVPRGWDRQLSTAPALTRVYGTNQPFPFYTAPTANTVTVDKWQQPLSVAVAVGKARQGDAFVPFNTVQPVAGFVSYASYQQPLSVAVPVAKVVQPYSFVPFNTAQTNTATVDKWQSPLSVAVAVARAIHTQPSFVALPFPQYPLGWLQSLSTAVNTLNPVATQPTFTTPPVEVPRGWYQALSQASLVAKVSFDNQSLPLFQAAPNTVTVDKWQQPLSVAVAVAKAQQGSSFVPLDTAQAAPAGIAGMAWFMPLGTVAQGIPTVPQGFAFVPFDTVQVAPPPPVFDTPPVPDNGGVGHQPRKKAKDKAVIRQRSAVYLDVFTQLERERQRDLVANLRDTTAPPPTIPNAPVLEAKLPNLASLGISGLDHAARSVRLEQIEKSRAQAWKRKQDEEALIALLLF